MSIFDDIKQQAINAAEQEAKVLIEQQVAKFTGQPGAAQPAAAATDATDDSTDTTDSSDSAEDTTTAAAAPAAANPLGNIGAGLLGGIMKQVEGAAKMDLDGDGKIG